MKSISLTVQFVSMLLLAAGIPDRAQDVPPSQASVPSGPIESSCVAQEPIWKQGTEFRHALCLPGVDVGVVARPIPGFAGAPSPIAYMVKVDNFSDVRVEADPSQWHLLWLDKKGRSHDDAILAANRIGISRIGQSFGRSTLFAREATSGFVYFKRPSAKEATIVITFNSGQGSQAVVKIGVSVVPLPLLP
jgi:hypothetical protein